jgi:hypothetical protein
VVVPGSGGDNGLDSIVIAAVSSVVTAPSGNEGVGVCFDFRNGRFGVPQGVIFWNVTPLFLF